jgi:NADPH:quinone reductase
VTVVEETMRALVCRAYGGPESLTYTEHPAPALGAGEIRIAIRAAGVNFADLMAIDGVHQNTPPAPFIPGFEVAGVVDAVGTGVKAFSPGNRVVAASGHGAFAELLVCPESHVAAIGDDVGFVSAAAAPIAFGTAYVALVHRAMLRSGEWLFVPGTSAAAHCRSANSWALAPSQPQTDRRDACVYARSAPTLRSTIGQRTFLPESAN